MLVQYLVLHRFAFVLSLLALCLGLGGCESDKAKAIRLLQERGIELSGMRLLRAVEEGDSETLGLLLEAGVFAGQRDSAGRMPLHLAVMRGEADTVSLLLDHGAAPDSTTHAGCTPLALAMTAGNTDLARQLVIRGAKPDGLTPDGERLLPWAIRSHRTDDIRLLLQAGADPHWKDEHGNPLLHLAMAAGSRSLSWELIQLGADCGALNAGGESTLILALGNGWRDLVGPLVRAGADPNAPGRDGVAPLVAAFEGGDFPLARELMDLGAVPSTHYFEHHLAKAYAARDFDRSQTLLRFGARPSTPGLPCLVRRSAGDDETGFLHLFLGYTRVPEGLLFESCQQGKRHVVGLLIAHGAQVNPSRAPFLSTPHGYAVEHGSDQLSLDLLEAGANPEGLTASGADPLHVAIVCRRAETVRHLLELGVDPNAEVKGPHSKRFLKQVRGATLRWLLEKDQRITPIMLGVDSGCIETVRVLLAHGAEKNVWTKRAAIWPINLAARNEDIAMMRLLLGKDPHVEERHVVVDLSDQELVVLDATGTELFRTRVSTGRSGYETPTGEFAITNRYRDWKSTLYHSSMPFFQRLSCSDFGFHRGYVPGRPASHGCIRVPSGKASKLYGITRLGDRVSIVP